jgi:hypothetical protein
MPFSTKKINMVIPSYQKPLYNGAHQAPAPRPAFNNSGIVGSIGAVNVGGNSIRRVFNHGSIIDRIQNIKGSGCGSCGGAK